MQILFKGIYCFKVDNPFKNKGSFVFILGLVDCTIKQIGKCSKISLQKIAVFKIPINEIISKNMVNVSRCCSCDSGRLIYGWYHAISE